MHKAQKSTFHPSATSTDVYNGRVMLDMLDIDGSGDISLSEFEDFFDQAPPLRKWDGMCVCACWARGFARSGRRIS